MAGFMHVMLRDLCTQLQSLIWAHVDEIDSIAHLRVLGGYNPHTPNDGIIEPESEAQHCPDLHREHRFDVAATETNLVGCGSHRWCPVALQFDRHFSLYPWIPPPFGAVR
jgi:hypothetical protein